MTPYLHFGPAVNIQWNLNASVGKGAQNSNSADVSYLQWYYTLAAKFPETPADRAAIYSLVTITGRCTGKDDDPLVKAIFAQQRGLQHPVIDGKASVAPSGGRINDATAYFILRLGARFASKFPRQWPRLDLIPGCPPEVARLSVDTVPKVV